MSWASPKTWVSGEVLSKADLNEQVRDNLNFLKQNIALETPSILTIDTGEVTKTQSHHAIAAESGTEDDLETINAGADGEVLLLRADTGDTIILKHDVGNIYNPLGEDVEITDSNYALLISNGIDFVVYASGYSEIAIQALIDAAIATHAADTSTHGVSEIADVSDIAVDANLSAAAQDAISKRHTQGTDTALGAVGTKDPPIDADKALYRDSTDSDALVTSTWTQVKAFLKTYFDTLYSGGGITKGTSFPETAEEGDFLYRSDLDKLFKCKETY